MNIWQNAVLTDQGIALLAKMVAGTSLTITRAVTGSGYVTPGTLNSQTAVTSPQQTMSFRTVSYPESGKVCVPAYLTNTGLTTGYTATQVGFYAQDPDDGEILYFIAQANSGSGTVVPSASEMPGFNAEWDFYFQYGQADDVTVTVDPTNTVNQQQVATMISDHNTSENAHAGVLAKEEDITDAISDHNSSLTAHSGVLATQASLRTHTSNTNNPHSVTAAQVGAYTMATTDEEISTAVSNHNSSSTAHSGVLATQSALTSHTGNTNNPHSVTANQVGLGTSRMYPRIIRLPRIRRRLLRRL